MAPLVTILNIGRATNDRIDGVSVAAGATTTVDLADAGVRQELRNDDDWVILPGVAGAPAGIVLAAPTAEAANARTVSVQVNDIAGAAVAVRTVLEAYVSTDATGDAPGDGSATAALTAGVDGALIGADESGATFVTEEDGDLDIVVTDAADAGVSLWLHVVNPTNGQIVSSAEIAFIDDTP